MVECTGLENQQRLVAFHEFESHLLRQTRSIAQPGSAPPLGGGGRRFESYFSDQLLKKEKRMEILAGLVVVGVCLTVLMMYIAVISE